MAAPNYQAIGPQASGGNTTVSWPTHQTNDLGILFMESAHNSTIPSWPPAGWTEIVIVFGSGNTDMLLAWKRATSAAEGAVTLPTLADHRSAVIMTVRNAIITGNPLDSNSGNSFEDLASTTVNFSTISTSYPEELIVYAATRSNDSAAAEFSSWGEGTERFDSGHTNGDGGGMGIATLETAATGTYGGTTVTTTNSSDHVSVILGILGALPLGSGKKSAVASSC